MEKREKIIIDTDIGDDIDDAYALALAVRMKKFDILGVTMPITKYSFIVKDVNQLADTIRKAFRIAKMGRPGPVLIDIPKDVTAKKAEYEKENFVPRHDSDNGSRGTHNCICKGFSGSRQMAG